MTYAECCEIFGINDIQDLPAAAMRIATGDSTVRHDTYRRLLAANAYDVSFDWFQPIYEAELSEGKRKGQHFTPPEVPELLSAIVGLDATGTVHEPTAGCGGLIIGDWWRRVSASNPWRVRPNDMPYTAWELSGRALPLLLINLSIRGIVGTVFHGDTLEGTVTALYRLVNRANDPLSFSDIILTEKLQ